MVGSCFYSALMDACHHYGQKQEGACQLHDPHKTEQEILAGNDMAGECLILSPLFLSSPLPLSLSSLPTPLVYGHWARAKQTRQLISRTHSPLPFLSLPHSTSLTHSDSSLKMVAFRLFDCGLTPRRRAWFIKKTCFNFLLAPPVVQFKLQHYTEKRKKRNMVCSRHPD